MPTGSSRARPPSWPRPETWGEGGPAAVPTGPGAANVGARTASVHTGAPPCRRGLPGRPRRNAHASGVGRRFAEKSSPVGRRSGRCLEPTRRGVDRRPPERQPVGSVPGAGPGRRGGITPRRPSTMGSREPDRRLRRHGAPRWRWGRNPDGAPPDGSRQLATERARTSAPAHSRVNVRRAAGSRREWFSGGWPRRAPPTSGQYIPGQAPPTAGSRRFDCARRPARDP